MNRRALGGSNQRAIRAAISAKIRPDMKLFSGRDAANVCLDEGTLIRAFVANGRENNQTKNAGLGETEMKRERNRTTLSRLAVSSRP